MEQNFKISLAAARVNAGMTQVDASKALGITKQTLINYESGKTSPTVALARRISEVYGVPIDCISFLSKSAI